MLWEYHEEKEVIRTYVLPKKSIKVGIWLPADKCLCVKKLKEAGLLKEAVQLNLVEHDGVIFDKMVKNAPLLSSVKPFCGKIENLVLDRDVEYGYLDYMGGINKDTAPWMSNVLSPRIAEGATIAITQQYAIRNNKTVSSQGLMLREEEGFLVRRKYGDGQPRELQMMLILLHRIFNRWDFNISQDIAQGLHHIELDDGGMIPHYKDITVSMLTFKLVNFKKAVKQQFRSL